MTDESGDAPPNDEGGSGRELERRAGQGDVPAAGLSPELRAAHDIVSKGQRKPTPPAEVEQDESEVPAETAAQKPGRYLDPRRPRDEDGPIESPFPVGSIRFMSEVREAVLALKLSGRSVRSGSINSALIGPVLTRIGDLAESLRASFDVEGLGSGASVFINFVHPSDEGEQFDYESAGPARVASENPEAGQPRSVEVAQDLIALVEVSTSEAEGALMDEVRRLPAQASQAYVELVKLLGAQHIDAAWLARDRRPVVLSAAEARRAHATLEVTTQPYPRDALVVGTLYQINSDNTKFRLRPEDGGKVIIGRFTGQVQPEIREAWGKKVEARLRFRERVKERTGEALRDQYELVEIDRILESNG